MEKTSREMLKRVDQFVKANNLEKALYEVRKARELDPKNLYAFAYEERIQELIAQREKLKLLDLKRITDSSTANRVIKPFNVNEHIINEHTDKYGVRVPALYEEFKKAGLRISDQGEAPRKKRFSKETLEIYRQALLLVWSDGQKTEEEIHELQDLRQSLSVTLEEHETLERQAKLECYILLLRHLLQSPTSKAETETSLAEIRNSFDVSNSDHRVIEANLATLKAEEKNRGIAVIDDDEQMLTVLKEMLTTSEYNVRDFRTSDEAYEFLQKETIDLILCDINLETSTMNGFLFYERIRDLQHLHHVPFVFITGLDDDVLRRAGIEMGVDDFLVKPIHRADLLATLRGRIKRYEQMKLLLGL